MKLYGRCNDLEMAFQVVDTYPQKYGFDLNAQVYTCLMSACIANGELTRAIDVYDRMTKAGCASDAKTYQTLLSGCLRHGDDFTTVPMRLQNWLGASTWAALAETQCSFMVQLCDLWKIERPFRHSTTALFHSFFEYPWRFFFWPHALQNLFFFL